MEEESVASDFNLISAFIDAGLADKGVLSEFPDCETMSYRHVVRDGKMICEGLGSDGGWERCGSTPRNTENEVLRQMTEYCDQRGVDVGIYHDGAEPDLFCVWDARKHEYIGDPCCPRPKALLAACVAIVGEGGSDSADDNPTA